MSISVQPNYNTTTSNTTTGSTAAANSSTSDVSNAVSQTLGQNDFLKLLVAELQNQDPSQSVDSTQFVAELAQFSSLEQMTNVATAVNKMDSDLNTLTQQSLLAQGAGLIGKQVTGTDDQGNTVQGTVDQVLMQNGNVLLQIGSSTLNLSQVNTIAAPAASTSTTTSTSSTGSASNG